jgi:DNA-directed RNA polymerase sigma subunit (sigma70/sigma32)
MVINLSGGMSPHPKGSAANWNSPSELRPDMAGPVEKRRLRMLVRCLPPNERLVIHALYGFLGESCSRAEVAIGLAITVAEVNELEEHALTRLRGFYGLTADQEAA